MNDRRLDLIEREQDELRDRVIALELRIAELERRIAAIQPPEKPE